MPKWATFERQAHLVRLLQESGGLCVHGQGCLCPNPDHFYLPFTDGLVRDWVADDREARGYEQRLAERYTGRAPDESGVWGRQFDPVARMAFAQQQPPFYLEAVGVDGLTFHRIAKVRVPSTPVRLFVDVSGAKDKPSQNARRKWRRYGKPLPPTVRELCQAAVRDYWK